MSALLVIVALGAACAAGKAFVRGNAATRAGNMDEAVAEYRRAVQDDPDNANYKIALQRAMLAASRMHLDKAREFENQQQLEAALGEYRQAVENDPSNRMAQAKVAELDKTIRDRIEASRPKPAIQQMRENVRRAEPALLNLTQVLGPIKFQNAPFKEVLTFIANAAGINIMYDRDVTDRPTTVQLDGATLEQALNQIMTMNQLSYKVVSDKTIFVFNDNAQNHGKYDEQVVQTFYLSHADATEVSQILSTIIRLPGIAVQPGIVPNRTTNTITVRATAPVVSIIEKIINQNDKPRAEIVIDVEILEVERTRAKQYGLNLSDYALGLVFSPEVSPSATTTPTPATTTPTTPGTVTAPVTTGTTSTNTGRSTGPTQVVPPPAFNLNTISRGVTTSDFYLAVPTAIVRFLESDNHTKVLAKPQLRGAEGAKLELKLGSSVPIISTSYTPIATGGAGVNPLSSYQYRDVGVNITMTPTVTLEGDIRMDLTLDDSQLGADKSIAGTTVPTFVQRTLTTRLRLRDGESTMLAGLLQDSEQKSVQGFSGLINIPIFKDLLSGNNINTDQLDIIMLLTPHIVRTHEITESDLKPIYIGSQQNLGVNGPSQLVLAQPEPQPPATPQAPLPPGAGQPLLPGPGGTTVTPPPGSSPVPGTVLVPTQPTQTAPATPPPPEVTQPQPPAPAPAAQPAAPVGTPATPPAVPTSSPGVGSASVLISPPPTMRVGGGPYTVPLSITDAVRLSTVTLTVIYDPTKLRVRTVQNGSFMGSGGANVSFAQQVNGNRVDITISRGADATGATGTGLLAAVLFDAIGPGAATLTVSGTATGPGGTAMGLRFTPVTVSVQQ
ncbi:MAG TPA: secretin N-terminal domain-containing protein [Vicinamibacterales bacterium]|nr:secretin N-terminal domain-containing protein [Vicinamibacterales bacterium]